MKNITKSEKETLDLAFKFAKKLDGGETIALIGDLGSGKTVFARGLARGLGIKKPVTSPTFVLMKNYPVNCQMLNVKCFVHIDAYRLRDGKDLGAIGVGDYFNDKDSVVVIEWADRVKSILPKDTIKIKFRVLDKDKREIEIV